MNKNYIAITVLWLICISLSTTLTSSTICRNSFYLAAFLALFDLLLKRPHITWQANHSIIVAILVLSISLYLPTILMPSVQLNSIDVNYTEAAKRLLVGAFILFYLQLYSDTLSEKGWFGAYAWLIIGFIYTLFLSIKIQYQGSTSRLEINTVATMVAYIFSLQSLATIFVLLKIKNWSREILVACAIGISIYIIVLTQTRAVILTYPLIVIALLFKEKFFNRRTLIFLFILLCIGAVIKWPNVKAVGERLASSVNEIQSYQENDDNTSLGARISIWKAGITAFKINSWGESADQRNSIAEKYILEHERSNPEALRSIPFHYHNDMLEAASLRGIPGLVVLLLFYLTVTVFTYKKTKTLNIFLLLILPTLLYGSTDTLFIDHRYITTFILLLTFYLCVETSPTHCRSNNKMWS